MNIVAYAIVFLLALECNNAEISNSSCQISGCPTGFVCFDTNNDLCNSESTPDCKCKQENFTGLFVTLDTLQATQENLYMLPTAPDGSPSLDNIQSAEIDFHFRRLLSIDVDYTLQQAYLYSKDSRLIYKSQNCSIDLFEYNRWTHLHRGISSNNVKLAVDWISHNIYWTDPYYKWIMVQSLLSNDQSMYHVLIYDKLEGPHALALDPMEGLLFWSDIGRVTKIEVSSLSGKGRKTLIDLTPSKPTSMAADHLARRIYFIDSSTQSIETVTYEGMDRKNVFSGGTGIFSDIAIYKDYLYVTDSVNDAVYFLNKTNGNQLHNITKGETLFYAVTVFRPETQPISTTDHCVSYGCEQICVTEKDGATCLCKDGYTLNQNMKTCSLSKNFFQRGVIYSNETNICVMDIRSIADFVFDPKCVLNTTGTKYLALDTDQRKVFFANDTAIYWAGIDNLELHLLTEISGIISGMAWDGHDRNLYWTENNTGIIWRVHAESGNGSVFLEGLNEPRDIMILPQERRVYWISDGNGSRIESFDTDYSNRQIIVDSNDLKDPRSLSYDPYKQRVYFMDDGKVKSCNLDGSNQTTILTLFESKLAKNLEIYKGHALMTSKVGKTKTKIRSASIESKLFTTSKVFSGNIAAIKVFDETLRKKEKVLE